VVVVMEVVTVVAEKISTTIHLLLPRYHINVSCHHQIATFV
jgi:hypothetical protein